MKELCIRKKNGGSRTIVVCNSLTKVVQRGLLEGVLNDLQIKHCPHAHGFIPGRNVVTNAQVHVGFKWTLSGDLKDFFDNCTVERVYDLVSPMELKAHNCLWKERFAQGLPTSPALANLSVREMDREIVEELRSLDESIVYTRYADDISVSFNDSQLAERIKAIIISVVQRHGHTVHPKKWSLESAAYGNRRICGVMVGEKAVAASRKDRRRLRAALHQQSKSAHGLGEWCKMRLPIAYLYEMKTKRKPSRKMTAALRLNNRKNRWIVRAMVEDLNPKALLSALQFCQKSEFKDEESLTFALSLASIFGADWMTWIKTCEKQKISVHDALYWLPAQSVQRRGLGEKLRKWVSSGAVNLRHLAMISENWLSLSPEQRAMSLRELCATIASFRYGMVKSKEFAEECSKHGVSRVLYRRYEDRWLKGINVQYESIPRFTIKGSRYTATILDREDPRGLWAGMHTDCCQHPLNDAKTSAWHGATNSMGAILAIFNKDTMIAQSWLWRHRNVVVADSIEYLKGYDQKEILSLYEQVGNKMLGKLCIAEFRVGRESGLRTPWEAAVKSVPSPKECYTDARKQKIVVSSPS